LRLSLREASPRAEGGKITERQEERKTNSVAKKKVPGDTRGNAVWLPRWIIMGIGPKKDGSEENTLKV